MLQLGQAADALEAHRVAAADLADCPSSDPDVPARDDGLPDTTPEELAEIAARISAT